MSTSKLDQEDLQRQTAMTALEALAVEYSPKNTRAFSSLTPGVAGKYHWICKTCAYEWESRVSHRIDGYECPACSKKILTTANPELVAEWGTQNTTTPDDHKPGARTRVWWTCGNQGHPEYLAAIANRRLLGTSCPLCNVPFKKSVAHKGSANILKHWSPKNSLQPTQVYANANTPVLWECDTCQYEWTTRASYRVTNDRGCPSCTGRLIEGKSVADMLPQIAGEWSKKNLSTADEIAVGSRNLFLWNCPNGHGEYQMRPMDRREGSRCRKCVLAKRSLAMKFPRIAKEWHPTKNGDLLPYDVMSGSAQRVWWHCDKSHEWETVVAARTGEKETGCPQCSQVSTSRLEENLRKQCITDGVLNKVPTDHNTQLLVPWRNRKFMRVDINGMYRGRKIVIEFDGWYWHSGQKIGDAQTPLQRDVDKTKALLNAGYLVVRIREETRTDSLPLLPVTDPQLFQTHWRPHDTLPDKVTTKIYAWLDSLDLV